MTKSLSNSLFIASLLLITLLTLTRCAQMVAPTGGKKDTIAPVLVSSNPVNKTTNFKGKTIVMTFDEYIMMDNLMSKLLITPSTDNPYTPTIKNETLTLKFQNPFKDSTTYTLNFGDGIKDHAEKNPAQNLKLVFSSGTSIDSGQVSGKVLSLQTGKPQKMALVGLYIPTDTLTPEKIKPYYFTKTDTSGNFLIENTTIRDFQIIAIADKNSNLLFNPKDEAIGFDTTLLRTAAGNAPTRTLYVSPSNTTDLKIQRTIPKVTSYSVVFNKGIDSIRVKFEKDSVPFILEKATDLKFFNINRTTDTIPVRITATDSLGKQISVNQKIAFQEQRGKTRVTEPFTYQITPEKNASVPEVFNVSILFSKPVSTFDKQKINLIHDSLLSVSLDKFTLEWNDFKNKVSFEVKKLGKDSLKIQLGKNAILSVENDTLPATLLKYKIASQEEYGILHALVAGDTKTPHFVELVDKDFNVVQTLYKAPFSFRNITPGQYYLRLILDKNRNKRWDYGNFNSKTLPEAIMVYPQPLRIKANFETTDTFFTIP